MAKKRIFSGDFKRSVLQDLEHKTVAQICREHNLQSQLVNRWKREAQDYPGTAFKGRGNLYKLEAKLAESQRLIGQLYAENALLKKAISITQERAAEERMKRCTK